MTGGAIPVDPICIPRMAPSLSCKHSLGQGMGLLERRRMTVIMSAQPAVTHQRHLIHSMMPKHRSPSRLALRTEITSLDQPYGNIFEVALLQPRQGLHHPRRIAADCTPDHSLKGLSPKSTAILSARTILPVPELVEVVTVTTEDVARPSRHPKSATSWYMRYGVERYF